MEATNYHQYQKMNIGRQRSYSQGGLDMIMEKSPSTMNDQEKVQWKVEVIRQFDESEDYVQNKRE